MSDTKCPKCNSPVSGSMEYVTCSNCNRCYHMKCSNLSRKAYDKYLSDLQSVYSCIDCKKIRVPFNSETKSKNENRENPNWSDNDIIWSDFFTGAKGGDNDENNVSIQRENSPENTHTLAGQNLTNNNNLTNYNSSNLSISQNDASKLNTDEQTLGNLFDDLSFNRTSESPNNLIDTCMYQYDTIYLLKKEIRSLKNENTSLVIRMNDFEILLNRKIREQGILNFHNGNELGLLKKSVDYAVEHVNHSTEA